MTVSPNVLSLTTRSKGGPKFGDTIDSKAVVKQLTTSQKYKPMGMFVTYTCNQAKNSGVCIIKNWIDSNDWTKHFPNFNDLSQSEQRKIQRIITQAASPLLLHNWMETRILFLEYLYDSPTSPYAPVDAIWARDKYQDLVGNLPYIHLIKCIGEKAMSHKQKAKMDDLIRASICNIVRSDKVQHLIDDGIFKSVDNHKDMQKDAGDISPRICTERCKKRLVIMEQLKISNAERKTT